MTVVLIHSVSGQSLGLLLSEGDLQRISRSPEMVDAKIKELQERADSTSSLAEKVSLLQTIILLEPHSRDAYCELSLTYDRIGELLMQVNASSAAIQMTHNAIRLTKYCDRFSSDAVYNHLGKLGTFHLLSHNYDSALYYFRQSENFSDTMLDPIWHASAMNNLGMVWMELGNFDSAYTYYNSAVFGLNSAVPEHQHMLGSVTDNLAKWHKINTDYSVALQLFSQNVERYRPFQDTMHMVKSLLGQAEAQLALEQFSEAEATLDSIEAWLRPFKKLSVRRAEQMLDYFRLQRALCGSNKKPACELQMADSLLVWQQLNFDINEETQRLMLGAINQAEFTRFNREKALRSRLNSMEHRSSEHDKPLIALLALACAIIVFLSYRLFRKR
ncbi:MAG: tetratricopeptide repeat protein [Flavobacteriales bacterium]|nr:tetratricopeptide repeat protein [Flavobacteriales bacterium]